MKRQKIIGEVDSKPKEFREKNDEHTAPYCIS
jgi:hypothetical protein